MPGYTLDGDDRTCGRHTDGRIFQDLYHCELRAIKSATQRHHHPSDIAIAIRNIKETTR